MLVIPLVSLLNSLQTPVSTAADQEVNLTRVTALVAASGLFNELLSNRSTFKFVFEHPDSRKQSIFLNGKPNVIGEGLKSNVVYTSVWVGNAPPARELMLRVFSQGKKFGQFYVYKDENKLWSIRFRANFETTNLTAAFAATDKIVTAFKDTIFLVNQVGEEMDRQLNGDLDIK